MNTNDNLQQPADGKQNDENALENAMVEESNNPKKESMVDEDEATASTEPVKPGTNKVESVASEDNALEDAMVEESSAVQQTKEAVIIDSDEETASPATSSKDDDEDHEED
ncbi:MAG: hypothetical protein NWQ19_06450, partial [Nonlabens sp.]|nr:hypothetical protein [Nonlabens sp.]